MLSLALVLVLGTLAVRYVWMRSPARQRKQAVRALLDACHGDHEMVERLLFFEMDRDDSIGFAEAARRARIRLQRDRR